MPPIIALFAYIILAIWLLKVEKRENPEVSPVLWIPTIYFMIMASRPVALWIHPVGGSGGSVEEGSPLDRVVLLVFIFIALIVIYRRKIEWSQLLKNNRGLILLYFFLALSILWSGYPYVSFKRWFKLLGIPIMALMIMTEQKPLQALESIFRRSAYILIPLSIVLIKYFPVYGREYASYSGIPMGSGVATQKNGLGALCAFLVFFLIWSGFQKWCNRELLKPISNLLANLIVFGIGIFLLFGGGSTYSATSVLVFVIGMLLLIISYRYKNLTRFLINNIKSLLIVSVVFFNLFYAVLLPFVTSSLNRRTDLTDRDRIWTTVQKIAEDQPMLGTGYGGFWGLDPRSYDKDLGVNQAHNGYLEVYLQVGVVGLVVLSIFIFEFCGQIRRVYTRNHDWGILGMCFLAMMLLYNYSEAAFIKANMMWSIMIFFGFAFSGAGLDLREDKST